MDQRNSPPPDFLPVLQTPHLMNSPFLDYIRYSEFKRLLGRIASIVDREKVQILSVLSAYPQEGKTFFVAAAALGYAVLLHKKVLIVNTALKMSAHSENIRKIYEEQLQFAPIYSAGSTPRPHRMIDLMSPQLPTDEDAGAGTVDFQIGAYLNTFKSHYDVILIDTCALTSTEGRIIDPIVIAGQADASIFLTSDRSMNHASIKEVKELLSQWQVKTLGSIHNGGFK